MTSQFYGKRDRIMINVPADVRTEAGKSFGLQKIGFRGGTVTGWKRAKQLTTQSQIPIQDLRFMRNWYARHVYTSYPGFLSWKKRGSPKTKEWYNKRSIISWLIWGGDSGLKFVNKYTQLLNKHYNKNYKPISR
jgi:hypothetical protein